MDAMEAPEGEVEKAVGEEENVPAAKTTSLTDYNTPSDAIHANHDEQDSRGNHKPSGDGEKKTYQSALKYLSNIRRNLKNTNVVGDRRNTISNGTKNTKLKSEVKTNPNMNKNEKSGRSITPSENERKILYSLKYMSNLRRNLNKS
jgi:hypothetical protein